MYPCCAPESAERFRRVPRGSAGGSSTRNANLEDLLLLEEEEDLLLGEEDLLLPEEDLLLLEEEDLLLLLLLEG